MFVKPAVVVVGGFSAGVDVEKWWGDFVGEGKPIDTRTHLVIGFDFLSHRGVTTQEQAEAIARKLDERGIERLEAFVGSSYGGMVGLAFAELYPQRVERLLIISAAHEPHPMASALRSLQRRVIELGVQTGNTEEAVSIARGIAMTTYRTAEEFAQRFNGPREVESYLEHCGDTYARSYSAQRFLALSESIDNHKVKPENINVPVTLVSVTSDTLVPAWQLKELAQRLQNCTLIQIESIFGHDAFLKEVSAVSNAINEALEGVYQ